MTEAHSISDEQHQEDVRPARNDKLEVGCYSFGAFVLFCTALLPRAALALEDGGSTTLGEVVVTATRDARALSEVPASVSVITREEIANTPAQSLDDILRRVPSLDVPISASYQLHPTADNVSMRGLGGIRALVLLDGVPLNDPFFGYVQWNRVPLESVDRVEVVRGGGAALWGNYAMGGVISIFTRAADKDTLVAQAGAGSYGTWRSDAYAAYAVSEGVKLGIEASANHTDGFNTAPADIRGAVNVPTAFTAHNVAFAGTFSPISTLVAHTRIDFHSNEQNLNSVLAFNTQRTWTYSADASQQLGNAGRLTATAFRNDSHFRTDNTDTPQGAIPGQAEFVQNRHLTPVHDTGGSLVWSNEFAGVLRSASVGVDYHEIDGRDIAYIFDDAETQIRTDIGRGKQRFVGEFAQVSLRPVEPLELLASVRHQSFDNFDAFDGAPGGLGAVPDQSASSVDPRLSLRWAATNEIAVRAAAYKAFRAPTLDNLYRAFATPSGIFFGNPALKPEELNGGEIGFDVNRGALRTQVTAYTNTVKNLITFAPLEPNQLPPGFFFGTRNINAGRARSRGIEGEADWAVDAAWSLRAGYTFADSTITESRLDAASVGKQQGGIPRHRLSAGLTYTAANGLTIAPQIRWLSQSWGDNDNTLPVDAHFVADLSVSYPFTSTLRGFVRIENLADRRYVADNSGFEPLRLGTPFSAFAGLRWELR
ncbi:TonB-dependent receptor [Rudaea sp.]|uniref:TonB-dependent receptor n=1 Tax=Rudaea sp. TaxID=2136325 RepID=UPI0032204B44